jgi:hypothetical protein
MPVTLAISVVGKTLATSIAKKFGGSVIERWTRRRRETFFQSFAEALAIEFSTGVQTEDVDKRLAELLADDTKSEVLFDAYRRVCFSKSKTLGPRIIGLLTGQLVHEGRMANYEEECIFEAAELLSDGDFVGFMKSYQEHRKKAEGITDPNAEHRMLGDSIIIRWSTESSDSAPFMSKFGNELDIGPFPWEEALGRWAVKLKASGLMEERVSQNLAQISLPNEGETIMTKVTTAITFCSGCAKLYELLSRSLGPDSSEGMPQNGQG